MAFIVQNQVLTDTRLQIGAEEITRPIGFGTKWTKLRIGMRLFAHSSSSYSMGDFLVGVCQGSKGSTAPDCTDAVYVRQSDYPDANLIWSYASNCFYTNFSSVGYVIRRKVGGSYQQGNGVSTINPTFPATPLGGTNLAAFYVDIVKTTTGITAGMFAPSALSAAIVNVTRQVHLINMENERNVYATNGQSYTTSGQAALNFSSAQLWDTVMISWTRSIPVWDVHDVSVCRFY